MEALYGYETTARLDLLLWVRVAERTGVPREDGFNITAASEIMAVLCLATSLSDLKERVANIMVAYDSDKKPIYVRDLGCQDAVCILLKMRSSQIYFKH